MNLSWKAPRLLGLPLFSLLLPLFAHLALFGSFLRSLEKAPGAFLLWLVVLSGDTCSRRDFPGISDPAGGFLGTQEVVAGVTMAVLPVETYWGFHTLL